jgi:hypothetical protein
MAIVDDLLDNTGVYVGIDTVTDSDLRGAARIVVRPLPGRAGVTLDYEIYNPQTPDRIRGHVEHTVIGRTHDGGALMVIGHDHSKSLTVLHETDPGTFELAGEKSPYAMKVVVSVPTPGRLRHSWWYGPADGEASERDVADLVRLE